MQPLGDFTSSNISACSEIEVIAQTEIEKDPWHDVLPSMERRGEMVKNMCINRALRNRLKQCIYETCRARKRAAGEMRFELLEYGTLVTWIGVTGGNISDQRGRK